MSICISTTGRYRTIEGAVVRITGLTGRYAVGYSLLNPDDDYVWDQWGRPLLPERDASIGMRELDEHIGA